MKNFIEELFYGNLEPQEINSSLSEKVKAKHKKLVEKEEQIRNMFSGRGLRYFEDYVELCNDFSCSSCADSFIGGFKYGAKFTYDTFVDD